MEKNEGKPSFDLVSDILEEARKEVEKITSDADREALKRIEAAEKRAGAVRSQNVKEIEERSARIRAEALRRADLEIRRMSLKEQELLFEAATSEAFRRLAEWVKDPGYREILKGWIVEAAVGLEAEKALVATSQAEARHMDDALLREAGKRVYDLTGRKVVLSSAPGFPTAGQGIVLSDESGKRAFNNLVQTRLVRYASEVRAVIHKELFSEP